MAVRNLFHRDGLFNELTENKMMRWKDSNDTIHFTLRVVFYKLDNIVLVSVNRFTQATPSGVYSYFVSEDEVPDEFLPPFGSVMKTHIVQTTSSGFQPGTIKIGADKKIYIYTGIQSPFPSGSSTGIQMSVCFLYPVN